MLVRIDISYATAGIIIQDGICRVSAPIFKWMIGKSESEIKQWVNKKKGTYEVCE